MSAELWFVQRCLEMPAGEREEYPPDGIIVTRYLDCWWALWQNPTRESLGRVFNTALELRAFLAGNGLVGHPITPAMHIHPELL